MRLLSMFEDKLIDNVKYLVKREKGNYKKGERQRDREVTRERERDMHVLKRGWTKEPITEMLIYLVL